jgi:hypothetical protein
MEHMSQDTKFHLALTEIETLIIQAIFQQDNHVHLKYQLIPVVQV